jgi:hypothetical protein
MSRENVKLAYLSGVALILIACVIVALGEGKKTSNNCKQSNQQVCLEQVQCDTICCDSTKCDSIKCDQQ